MTTRPRVADMPAAQCCPRCGAPLPGSMLGGLCPRCLVRVSLSPEPEAEFENGLETAPAPPLPALRSIGEYELLEEIARGGMGVIFKARHRRLDRLVALKMILSGRLAGETDLRRFRIEAEALAQLRHPHIVTIHEIGEYEGQPYLAMDWVEGRNLAQVIAECRMPNAEFSRWARYLKQIAEAVHHAHQHQVLHRDLKPSNILLDAADQPRLTDFGLAKRVESPAVGTPGASPPSPGAADGVSAQDKNDSGRSEGGPSSDIKPETSNPQLSTLNPQLTLTGQVLGSPSYAPPEQAGGRRHEIGPVSDIYSLGAILYHLLTGRPPFLGETLEQTLAQVQTKDPISPHALNPLVPRDLETICLKCLEKDPAHRYPTAQALADELGRYLRHEPILARPLGRLARFWRWCQRNPTLATSFFSISLLLLLLLTGSPLALYHINRQRERAEHNAAAEQSARHTEQAQRRRAEATIAQLRLQKAETLFEKNEPAHALAHLALVLRHDPANRAAAERILSALASRSFPLPAQLPLPFEDRLSDARFSPNSTEMAVALADGTVSLWPLGATRPKWRVPLHAQSVGRVEFSPDGRRLVTASIDGTARVWDAATGRPVTPPLPHQDRVEEVAFSPDGKWILTSSFDNTARVWDAGTGQPRTPPLLHPGKVGHAQFSVDGRRVLTRCVDDRVRLWDAQTGEPVGRPLPHSGFVHNARLLDDGTQIATVISGPGLSLVQLWNVESGEPVEEVFRTQRNIAMMRSSLDGQSLALIFHDGPATILERASRRHVEVSLPSAPSITAADIVPQAGWLATVSRDQTVRLWSMQTGQPVSEPLHCPARIPGMAFSPDGRRLLTLSRDRAARIWDIQPGARPRDAFRVPAEIRHVQLKREPALFVTVGNETIQVWDARRRAPIGSPMPGEPGLDLRDIEISPDGQRLAAIRVDHIVYLWDVQSGQRLSSTEGPAWLQQTRSGAKPSSHQHVKFSEDSQKLLFGWSELERMQVWDARTGQPISPPIKDDGRVMAAAFSPDGRKIATGNHHNTAQVWDAQTGQRLGPTLEHNSDVMFTAFSPDGRRLATGSEYPAVRLWEVETGRPLTPPLHLPGGLVSLSFSPDGHRLLAACADGSVNLWDGTTGETLTPPLRHRGRVGSARFSPDGRRIVIIADDHTARLWDTGTGNPLSDPLPFAGQLYDAGFSPDGSAVLAATQTSVEFWPVPLVSVPAPDWLPRLAEAVAGERLTDRDALQPVPDAEFFAVKSLIESRSATDVATCWAQWFLADRATRPPSPQ